MDSRLLDDLEHRLAAGLREDARKAGLTEALARILLALDPAQTVAMGPLARRIGRTPSTTTRFVDRAERDGLVQREPGRDRRRRMVRLTERGRQARAGLRRLREDRAAALPRALRESTGLGEDQAEWFLAAIRAALGRTARRREPGP